MSTLKSAHRRACMKTTVYTDSQGNKHQSRHFTQSLKNLARELRRDPRVQTWAANKWIRL